MEAKCKVERMREYVQKDSVSSEMEKVLYMRRVRDTEKNG